MRSVLQDTSQKVSEVLLKLQIAVQSTSDPLRQSFILNRFTESRSAICQNLSTSLEQEEENKDLLRNLCLRRTFSEQRRDSLGQELRAHRKLQKTQSGLLNCKDSQISNEFSRVSNVMADRFKRIEEESMQEVSQIQTQHHRQMAELQERISNLERKLKDLRETHKELETSAHEQVTVFETNNSILREKQELELRHCLNEDSNLKSQIGFYKVNEADLETCVAKFTRNQANIKAEEKFLFELECQKKTEVDRHYRAAVTIERVVRGRNSRIAYSKWLSKKRTKKLTKKSKKKR